MIVRKYLKNNKNYHLRLTKVLKDKFLLASDCSIKQWNGFSFSHSKL